MVLRVDGADPHARALHGARLLTEHEVEAEIGGCSRGGEARIAGADDEQVDGFGLSDLVDLGFGAQPVLCDGLPRIR